MKALKATLLHARGHPSTPSLASLGFIFLDSVAAIRGSKTKEKILVFQ